MGVVFLFAFMWGYKKDQIYSMINNPTSNPAKEQSSPGRKGDTAASQEKPGLPQVSSQNLEKLPALLPQTRGTRSPVAGSPVKSLGPNSGNPLATGKQYLPQANPYSNLSKQLKPVDNQASFKEAFGSIKRNSISQKELMKKNAYFRKLSKDLEEMQGDKPAQDTSTSSDKSIEVENEIGADPSESQELDSNEVGSQQSADIDEDEEFLSEEQDTEESIIDDLDSLIDDADGQLE